MSPDLTTNVVTRTSSETTFLLAWNTIGVFPQQTSPESLSLAEFQNTRPATARRHLWRRNTLCRKACRAARLYFRLHWVDEIKTPHWFIKIRSFTKTWGLFVFSSNIFGFTDTLHKCYYMKHIYIYFEFVFYVLYFLSRNWSSNEMQ